MGVFTDTVGLSEFELVEGATTDNSNEINDANFTLAYTRTFEKGEGIALGQGRAANQTDAVGRIYHEIDEDTGTDIEGYTLRVAVLNRQDNVRRVIAQFSEDQISRGASDRTNRQPLPVQERNESDRPVFVAYPYKIGLLYKLNDGTANIDNAESGTTAAIDVLRYEDTGGR